MAPENRSFFDCPLTYGSAIFHHALIVEDAIIQLNFAGSGFFNTRVIIHGKNMRHLPLLNESGYRSFFVSLILAIISTYPFCNLLAQELLPFEQAGQWGYKTPQGEQVIKPQYQFARRFNQQYAVVSNHNLSGVIDRSNRLIIPFKYDLINYVGSDQFVFGFRDTYFGEYKQGVITAQNQVLIKPVFRSVTLRAKHYVVQTTKDSLIEQGQFRGSRSVKASYGLYDLTGHVLLPCEYDYLSWLDDSLLVLSLKDRQALYMVTGKPLTSFDYLVISEFYEGLARVVKDKLHGFINKQGKLVIAPRFTLSEPFANGMAMVMLDNRWGAIDRTGQFTIDPVYSFKEVKAMLDAKINK